MMQEEPPLPADPRHRRILIEWLIARYIGRNGLLWLAAIMTALESRGFIANFSGLPQRNGLGVREVCIDLPGFPMRIRCDRHTILLETSIGGKYGSIRCGHRVEIAADIAAWVREKIRNGALLLDGAELDEVFAHQV